MYYGYGWWGDEYDDPRYEMAYAPGYEEAVEMYNYPAYDRDYGYRRYHPGYDRDYHFRRFHHRHHRRFRRRHHRMY